MKVWITRPISSEVYSGGLRSALLWIERPRFDHRPSVYEFDLIDSNGHLFATVYREQGWTSPSGSLRVKSFLKQSPVLYQRVWNKIYYSILPISINDPEYKLSVSEYKQLLDDKYELNCKVHYKRFLLELDLLKMSVNLVHPEIIIDSPQIVGEWPLNHINGLTELFLNENMNNPYIPSMFKNYRISREFVSTI